MYKLMVVDDENIVIESVKHIVEKEINNIEVVHTARSGRMAIEKARNQSVDIILMDIKMPGINGLEAITEIKKMHPDIKFIIVSAYEHFEFAKEAVKIGVSEYLIKPVLKNKLIEILAKVTDELDEEREKQNLELETKEKMDKMLPIIEHGFIYSLLLAQGHKVDISRYKSLFNINTPYGCILLLTFKDMRSKNADIINLKDGLQIQKFYEYLRDNMKFNFKCLVGPVILDRVIVYIAQDNDDIYKQKVYTIGVLENLISKLISKFKVTIKAGIGNVHSDENIMISYQEALKAINFRDNEILTHIDDAAYNMDNLNLNIMTEELEIISAIEKGDTERSISILNDLLNKYKNTAVEQNLKNKLIEIMVFANKIAMENIIDSDSYLQNSDYINDIMNCSNQQEMHSFCIEKIRYITNGIRRLKKKNISTIVDKANTIINERFSEKLSLLDISKELGMSPQYFSKLFKDEMNINFIDQLTAVRIEHAKKLIKQGNYSIKEVCYMSGYSDPNYFSRLFKRHVGVSPSTLFKQQ